MKTVFTLLLNKIRKTPSVNFCLVCGVDSGPVLTFFIWLIGGAVLATVCFLLWGISHKRFGDESNAQIPLQVEEGEQ
jgi:hypothetical protein